MRTLCSGATRANTLVSSTTRPSSSASMAATSEGYIYVCHAYYEPGGGSVHADSSSFRSKSSLDKPLLSRVRLLAKDRWCDPKTAV